jgi:hypothetical protein
MKCHDHHQRRDIPPQVRRRARSNHPISTPVDAERNPTGPPKFWANAVHEFKLHPGSLEGTRIQFQFVIAAADVVAAFEALPAAMHDAAMKAEDECRKQVQDQQRKLVLARAMPANANGRPMLKMK